MNKRRFSKKRIIVIAIAVILFFLLASGSYITYVIHRNHYAKPNVFELKADISNVSGSKLTHYYIHANGQDIEGYEQGMYSNPPFDADGIPLVDYGSQTGKQYNPTTICQFALSNWERFLKTNDKNFYDVFIKQADWLVNHQENGKWYYRFDMPAHILMKNPWASSIAQGQGISVLLRAYQSTGDKKYLEQAQKAFEILITPVAKGGVAYQTDEGVWYEEYPSADKPSHVLNGHIWALLGIWDLYRVTGSSAARSAFEQGVRILKKSGIAKYDTGYWVLYEQRRSVIINTWYMGFMVEQLKVLYAITNDSVFSEYAGKWERYKKETSFLIILRHHIFKDKIRRFLR